MRKADIKVGEKYALKSWLSKTSPEYGPAEVVGFEPLLLRGRRYYTGDRKVTGVKVRFADTAPEKLAGTTKVIETKYVSRPWAEYVEANKRARRLAAERKAHAERSKALADRLKEALEGVGIKAGVTGYRGVRINGFYGTSADSTEYDAVERLIEILTDATTKEEA